MKADTSDSIRDNHTGDDTASPGPTFLVVDDEPMVRKIVSRGLTKLNPEQVFEVDNGHAAQDILLNNQIDVVVTDVLMPGMSGLELMEWAQEHAPDPLWIVLSGLETFDAAVDALQLGAFDYLAKPPEVQRVRVAVRNALDQMQLIRERTRLYAQIELSNVQLEEKVEELEDACWKLEEQAAIIQSDLDRAEVIQRSLLPQEPPDMEGWCVETLYRSGSNVGGDLYDVIRIDQDHVGLVVADAAGHGVAAAMLSVLFKLRLNLTTGDGTLLMPNQVLSTLNRKLHDNISAPGAFITAAYALVNRHTGWTRIASAGHPPCILGSSGGEPQILERTGPALGLEAQAEYGEHKVLFDVGDRLLLYTDGVLASGEAASTCEDLACVVCSGTDRCEVPGTLYRAATSNTSVERDDITMILLERAEGESHFDDTPESEESAPTPPEIPQQAALMMGHDDECGYISVSGTVSWTSSQTFLEGANALGERFPRLVINLSACEYLDSTCLGTLHEIVVSNPAAVSIQHMSDGIRELFTELSMSTVLDRASPDGNPLPDNMAPMQQRDIDPGEQGERMLSAHEALANLSPENQQKFKDVVDSLRSDLEQ